MGPVKARVNEDPRSRGRRVSGLADGVASVALGVTTSAWSTTSAVGSTTSRWGWTASSPSPISSTGCGAGSEVSGLTVDAFVGDLTDHRFVETLARPLRARGRRALRRAALRALLDDRPGPRRLHPGQQRGGHPQPPVRHRRDASRHPPGEARDHGGVRHPNIDIEEGFIEITHKGRTDVMPYPKQPGSFYHLSKVHDSHNMHVRLSHLGPAGHRPQPGRRLRPGDRRDRPCTPTWPRASTTTPCSGPCSTASASRPWWAIPSPSTARAARPGACSTSVTPWPVWSWPCSNPADAGEFRVFNQFTESFSVQQMAEMVADAYPGARSTSTTCSPTPGWRSEEHYYRRRPHQAARPGLRAPPARPTSHRQRCSTWSTATATASTSRPSPPPCSGARPPAP